MNNLKPRKEGDPYQKKLKELARMVIDEMSDPSPELTKLLIKYVNMKV